MTQVEFPRTQRLQSLADREVFQRVAPDCIAPVAPEDTVLRVHPPRGCAAVPPYPQRGRHNAWGEPCTFHDVQYFPGPITPAELDVGDIPSSQQRVQLVDLRDAAALDVSVAGAL